MLSMFFPRSCNSCINIEDVRNTNTISTITLSSEYNLWCRKVYDNDISVKIDYNRGCQFTLKHIFFPNSKIHFEVVTAEKAIKMS